MPRFFVEPRDWRPPQFTLRGEEAHHASRVLRLGPGAEVRVFQGEGEEWQAQIETIASDRVHLAGLAPAQEARLPARLILLQALPKGSKMELIIQKSVELGVSEIRPLAARRSVVRLDAAQAARKVEKWQKIAVEAAKQCGHPRPPRIHPPQTLAAALDQLATDGVDLILLTSLQDDTVPLLRALNSWRVAAQSAPSAEESASVARAEPTAPSMETNGAAPPVAPPTIAVLIGPEGDFTSQEIAAARTTGAVPVSLGPLVLRTETAALAALAQLGAGLAAES